MGQNTDMKYTLIDKEGKMCSLGGTISTNNFLTVHHLKPIRLGGRTIYVNCTLLCTREHGEFNNIELYLPGDAEELNCGFRELKIINTLEDKIEYIRQLKERKNDLLRVIGDYKPQKPKYKRGKYDMRCVVCNEKDEEMSYPLNDGSEIGICMDCAAVLNDVEAPDKDRLHQIVRLINYRETLLACKCKRLKR